MANEQSQQLKFDSWEEREKQIRLERLYEFAKLSPQEQQKILQEEKIKFQKYQEQARESLGYKKFNSENINLSEDQKKEEKLQEAELLKINQELQQGDQVQSEKSGENEIADDINEDKLFKRYKEMYFAAVENISKKISFEFSSISLNDKGRNSIHKAFMTDIIDNSEGEKKENDYSKIWQKIERKEISPNQITILFEIDMGEDKDNNLGLKNLSLEIPLGALLDGKLSEKLSRFTNIIFFAADQYKRRNNFNIQGRNQDNEQKPVKILTNQELQKIGITRINEGPVRPNIGEFAKGNTNTIAFSFNNGFIWGTLDSFNLPQNPQQLSEAIDKKQTDN